MREVVTMMNTTLFGNYSSSWRISGHRAIRVRVISGGHEVDCFEASSCDMLRSAIRPIYAHMPLSDSSVQFTGIELESFPLGISRQRRVLSLDGLRAALGFLGGKSAAKSSAEEPVEIEPKPREKTAA
jgi:hypothetical protein